MKKKILLIHHSGLIGGGSISFYNILKALEKKYEIACYIPSYPSDFSEFLKAKNIKHNTFDFKLGKITYYNGGNSIVNPKLWLHALNAITQVKYWKKVVKVEKPDLIYLNSKVLCWMSLIFKNNKTVCFVRETIKGDKNNPINKTIKFLLDKFNLVAFLSNYDRNQIKLEKAHTLVSEEYLIPEEYSLKLKKDEACKELKLKTDSFNILFMGGVNELKGIDVALRAINRIKSEDLHLIVAGQGLEQGSKDDKFLKKIKNYKSYNFSNKIKTFIRDNTLEDNVSFIGVQNDMSICISACDICIFPMKKAHQARPIFEVGIQKKTIIVTDFPNIKEHLKDEVNGLTFKLNDYQSLSTEILRLKNNELLMKELGNNNYDLTMKYHTKDYALKKLLDMIELYI